MLLRCLLTLALSIATLTTAGSLTIVRAADDYRISGPVAHENLAIYFVHGKSSTGPVPLTLEEALQRKVAKVKETGEVNELQIENAGDQEIFVQSGDIVKGGQQDRVLTSSLILPSHSGPTEIASFCVEHGRWSARGTEDVRAFSSARALIPSREAKIAMKSPAAAAPAVAAAPTPDARAYADTGHRQQEVWKDVAKIRERLSNNLEVSVASPVSESSLQLALENDKLNKAQDAYVEALRATGEADGDVVGFVFAINGKLNSADVYPSNGLFRKMWPKLLRASAAEAIADRNAAGRAAPPSTEDVTAFLKVAEHGTSTEKKVTDRVGLETRDSAKALYFETRTVMPAQASRPAAAPADAWVHRNYLAK